MELDGSEMNLSHTSNPWNAHSRLVKVVVLDVVVLEPPEKPSYTLAPRVESRFPRLRAFLGSIFLWHLR